MLLFVVELLTVLFIVMTDMSRVISVPLLEPTAVVASGPMMLVVHTVVYVRW
jgi:hypothetical protein